MAYGDGLRPPRRRLSGDNIACAIEPNRHLRHIMIRSRQRCIGVLLPSKSVIIFDHDSDEALDQPYSFSDFPFVDQKSLGEGYYFLRLGMTVADDLRLSWRSIVVQLGADVIFEGPVQGAATLAFRLSPNVLAQLPATALQIRPADNYGPPGLFLSTLKLIWAPVLGDSRSVPAGMNINARTIALQFESLGDNCEFGLFQRRVGAESLGLLRFASTRVDQLLTGLADGFSGFDIPSRIEIDTNEDKDGLEYISRQKDYGVVFHTHIYEGEMTQGEVHAQELTRLRYLRRKFIEDLENAEKVFVIRRDPPLRAAEALPVWLALREYGPNRLLCVAPAKEGHPAGSIDVIAEGLMMGYVDWLAPYSRVHDAAYDSWLELCFNVLTRYSSVARWKARLKRLWPLVESRPHNTQQRREPVGGRQ